MANARISYMIVGNGIAGITASEVLRSQDAVGSITIVADDPFPVYYRPALKDYLAGQMSEERLWARPSSFYQDRRIGFIPARVMGINAGQRIIRLHNGQQLGYQTLLLAQGARPNRLGCPGMDLAGVSTLRTVADYQEIVRHLDSVKRVVICGSGTLALESAEVLRKHGCLVTHLLRGTSFWSEVLDPAASDLVLQEERRSGIDVHLNEEIAEIVGKNGRVSSVVTTSGTRIPCELVIVAIGIQPNIEFLQGSGVACRRGIQVDHNMRTSVPYIYAAGDVVETVDEVTGRIRLPGQWYPAIRQARAAAYGMLHAGEASSKTPADQYSWSRNYYNATFLCGLDFVSIGLVTSPQAQAPSLYQEVFAAPQPRNYRKALLKRGVLVGALFLGARQHALAFKRAIDHQVDVSTVATRLFDDDFDFDSWLDQQRVPPAILNLQQITGKQAGYMAAGQEQSRAATIQQNQDATEAQSAMEAVLTPITHPKVAVSLQECLLLQDKPTTIGRQEQAVLRIDHRSVSRYHAEISYSNGTYVLRDMGSSNGTFINRTPLLSGKTYPLHQNDHVRLGDVQLRFEWRQSAFQHLQGTPLQASASRAVPEHILANLPATPTLVLIGQQTKPVIVPLEPGKRFTIGRDAGNTIPLDDVATSQTHAELFPVEDGFYIRDTNSRNGVFVNKAKINNPHRLMHGDRIVIGNMLLYFSFPQSVPQSNQKTAVYQLPVLNKTTPLPESAVVPGLSHRPDVQPLDSERIHFEIDMCIGCDRCMVACPLPLSSTVTIADLNQATVEEKISPVAAEFTHACIMCGSCVPVCPVDNHRDLLMLSLKQRLRPSWEGQANAQRIAERLPAGWTIPLLLQQLRKQPALRDAQQVPDNYLLHLVEAARFLTLQSGETVIREGAYGRDLYLILDGRVTLFASGGDSSEFPVAVLGQGEHVGEDGMLTGKPYNATAKVQAPAIILQVPEQVMQHLMELVPYVNTFFGQVNNARSLRSILKRMALFQGVSDADINFIIQQANVKQYGRDEALFAENDSDKGRRPARETLHILLEGFVKVVRLLPMPGGNGQQVERIIAYRQGGDYFAGGLDLLGDGRAVSVVTINRVRVAEISRQVLLALFQRYPEVNQRFANRLREYAETATIAQQSIFTGDISLQSMLKGTVSSNPIKAGLHSLVNDGVVEGTEVLVIDLDKCIHCNECEEACERRHGHSRMNRSKGMVIGNISITTTCRQCQDPVCMLCSRAGIARTPDGEVYITESCIGCGICAERCPYGAISIVDVEGENGNGRRQREISPHGQTSAEPLFGKLFARGSEGKRQSRKRLPMAQLGQLAPGPLESPTRDAYNELRKKIAIKCDLCAGYKDQACVQACPTGAAIRVRPTEFFGSTEEILSRDA
jgi:NADPH-dependent 2,4-dienoyl-CoA reductase/sulfur reductase-like enzyme/pSer/pThr/pTyr-binding forkhead associated (FHA) protein/Fe-S-cluster-containing hydrogenase component 2/CRP-like cAMP-binding protein